MQTDGMAIPSSLRLTPGMADGGRVRGEGVACALSNKIPHVTDLGSHRFDL